MGGGGGGGGAASRQGAAGYFDPSVDDLLEGGTPQSSCLAIASQSICSTLRIATVAALGSGERDETARYCARRIRS